MNRAVGMNVRKYRLTHSWTQQQLADEMDRYGAGWSQSICAQAEAGRRPISVAELLALGLVLGVAPHLLLYPVDDVEAGETVIDAYELTRWLWKPDDHRWTSEDVSERDLVIEAMEQRIAELELSEGEKEELIQQAEQMDSTMVTETTKR